MQKKRDLKGSLASGSGTPIPEGLLQQLSPVCLGYGVGAVIDAELIKDVASSRVKVGSSSRHAEFGRVPRTG